MATIRVLVLLLGKRKRRDINGVTFSNSYGYMVAVFFFALAFLVFAYWAVQRIPVLGFERGGVSALTRSTVAYRVPDKNSVPSARFMDGTVVRILSSAVPWAYVENRDGGAGWVPFDRLIRY